MARVVEKAAQNFGKNLDVRIVVTKTRAGAERYKALVQTAGRLLPVPSIIINGQLTFETTPDVGTLRDCLESMMKL